MLGIMLVGLGTGLASPADVHWTAPAGCPTQASVSEQLQALVGDDVVRPDLVAHAQVRSRGDEWVLELSLHMATGSITRQMVADECQTLADAVALVVATFADPVAVSAHVEERSPSVPTRIEAVRGGPAPLPSQLPERRAHGHSLGPRPTPLDPHGPPPMGWGMRLGVVAGRATQADLDLGPYAELSWQRGSVRVAIDGLGLVPRRQPVPEHDGARLRQWMLAGGLQAGVVMPVARRMEMLLSLGIELGPIVARGEGIARPRTVVSPWLAALGTAQLVWRPTPRWGIWAGVVGVAGVLLPRFTVAGGGPLVAGPSGLRGIVGVERRWGGITNSR